MTGPEQPVAITLTPRAAALLAIAAAHDRTTPEGFVTAAICRRVEEIGIASAVDWMEGEGHPASRGEGEKS